LRRSRVGLREGEGRVRNYKRTILDARQRNYKVKEEEDDERRSWWGGKVEDENVGLRWWIMKNEVVEEGKRKEGLMMRRLRSDQLVFCFCFCLFLFLFLCCRKRGVKMKKVRDEKWVKSLKSLRWGWG